MTVKEAERDAAAAAPVPTAEADAGPLPRSTPSAHRDHRDGVAAPALPVRPTAPDQPLREATGSTLGQPLFRSEVIEARRSQWLGPVLLAPRPSHRLFAGLALLAVAALVALLALGEFTRKARVTRLAGSGTGSGAGICAAGRRRRRSVS